MRFIRPLVTALLVFLTLDFPARAGGGPERVLLVVNARSQLSMEVASHYRQRRDIPDSHVLFLDQVPGGCYAGQGAISTEECVQTILGPVLDYLDQAQCKLQHGSTWTWLTSTFVMCEGPT